MALKRKEQHHISVLIVVKGKCPAIYAVTHSNETHDVHFLLKYHIHNHHYGYYISRDLLYCNPGYDQDASGNKHLTSGKHILVYY